MPLKPLWTNEDILRATGGKSSHSQKWEAQGVSIDSRTLQRGNLFIALQGPAHDGHHYVAAALAAGAAGAIVANQPTNVAADAPLIFVDDTTTALENLGRASRFRSQGKIIGVTGSVGKTTNKEMLRLMLGANGSTYATQGNLNNQWGLPLSLARMSADIKFGIMEMGMNHAGEISVLSRIAQPHVALISTVEAVHLEFFTSVEAIADAKAEIFYGMSADGTAVLNRDNPHYMRLYAHAQAQGLKHILGFGHDAGADARILAASASGAGNKVSAEILGHKIQYQLNIPGNHMIMNSLGALLAAFAAGGDLETCAAALGDYQGGAGRGALYKVALPDGNFSVIDESYNASPVSVKAAIRVLGDMTPGRDGRKILVLGDMKELGATAPELHADLAPTIIQSKIDRVFCCGDMMAHLHEALPDAMRTYYASDSAELALEIVKEVRAGDIVTIKGSHSMKMDVIVNALKALGKAG